MFLKFNTHQNERLELYEKLCTPLQDSIFSEKNISIARNCHAAIAFLFLM